MVAAVLPLLLLCLQLARGLGAASAAAPQGSPLNAAPHASNGEAKAPLLVRAARGEAVERVPVWMMRQAGRHMKVYRDLAEKHRSFKERSENPDLAVEISLQPWRAYKTDGVILFSDILTPLSAMGAEFDIPESIGPQVQPVRTARQVAQLKLMDCAASMPFVAETLQRLRKEVKNEAAVLGFVGAPFTLAAYLVEGCTAKNYLEIKKMAYNSPQLLHAMLDLLAENIARYAIYQIENGAQAMQLFDTWAAQLAPTDYDEFVLPYQQRVIQRIKQQFPDVPVILYIQRAGAIIEKMADSGADVLSLDWTIGIQEARRRLGPRRNLVIQGNLDPAVLFGPQDLIRRRTEEVLLDGGGHRHIMNLGHGIEKETPEENAKVFIDTVRQFRFHK